MRVGDGCSASDAEGVEGLFLRALGVVLSGVRQGCQAVGPDGIIPGCYEDNMHLNQALGLQQHDVVAFVGAGGKTTALFRLASELLAQRLRVVATTTTHMWPPPASAGWPLIIEADAGLRREAVLQALAVHGQALAAAALDPSGRLIGIPPDRVDELAALCDVTLVESDGARSRCLKAPAPHEPVIPPNATLVVPVAGLQVLGQPLDEATIHRSERLATLLGLTVGSPVTEESIARLLLHEEGALKSVPSQARVVPFLNQADSPSRHAAGRTIASMVLRRGLGVHQVAVGAAQVAAFATERWTATAVIVLAAGAARRFGALKQAQKWGGQAMLSRVVAAALGSLAAEVRVVLGCGAERLLPLLAEQASPRLRHTVNPNWAAGLSTSLRAGLQSLSSGIEAAVFCHADQPLLTATQIDALLHRHAATGASIVASHYHGAPRSPTLFSRHLFAELGAQTGDIGGRRLLERYREQVEWIEADEALPYEDIDTPADWARLRRAVQNGET